MKGKNEKVPAKEEPQDEKTGTVDQIKKKYGYTLTGVSMPPTHLSFIYYLICWRSSFLTKELFANFQ